MSWPPVKKVVDFNDDVRHNLPVDLNTLHECIVHNVYVASSSVNQTFTKATCLNCFIHKMENLLIDIMFKRDFKGFKGPSCVPLKL